MRLSRLLNICGAVSCSLGGFFGLIAWVKNKHARQLQGAVQIDHLTGKYLKYTQEKWQRKFILLDHLPLHA